MMAKGIGKTDFLAADARDADPPGTAFRVHAVRVKGRMHGADVNSWLKGTAVGEAARENDRRQVRAESDGRDEKRA